jgi:dolichol-phosphate mannosyltransferase
MVPALNVGRRLEATIATITRALGEVGGITAEVLIIDDGSSDDTGTIADRLAGTMSSVRVIRHPTNQGLGASFREALARASGRKFLIVPGDNDLSFDTLTLLLRHRQAADLVMCFFLNREERGRWRNLLSDLFALTYAMAFDVHVRYINGPSVYPTALLREASLKSRRFSIVAEAHVKLLRQGASFIEVPGYMQTGTVGSNAVTFQAFTESMSVFLRLLWEIHVGHRRRFSAKPRRVACPIELIGDTGAAIRGPMVS